MVVLWHNGSMTTRFALSLAALLIAASSASAFDCSVQCPYGTGPKPKGNGLFFISDLARESEVKCELVATNNDPTDPLSWCNAIYTFDNDDMWCSSCDPISYKLDTCRRVAKDAYSWKCEAVNDGATASVACCGPVAPAACQGGCGNAGCSIGDCAHRHAHSSAYFDGRAAAQRAPHHHTHASRTFDGELARRMGGQDRAHRNHDRKGWENHPGGSDREAHRRGHCLRENRS